MEGLPWYLARYRLFLVPPLLAALLISAAFLGDRLGPQAAAGVKVLLASKPFGLVLAISAGLSVWAFAEYGHLAAVAEALGPRLLSVRLVSPLRSATVLCTTIDGRELTLLFEASYKGLGYHYEVWVATEKEVAPEARERAASGIRRLHDIRVLPAKGKLPRRVSARVRDPGNLTIRGEVTQDVVRAIDALYELTR